jgi:hypothetical protein
MAKSERVHQSMALLSHTTYGVELTTKTVQLIYYLLNILGKERREKPQWLNHGAMEA